MWGSNRFSVEALGAFIRETVWGLLVPLSEQVVVLEQERLARLQNSTTGSQQAGGGTSGIVLLADPPLDVVLQPAGFKVRLIDGTLVGNFLQWDGTNWVEVQLPVLQALAPVSRTSYDWDFGGSFAAIDAAWGISAHMTISPTALVRGASWTAAGTIRTLVLNGALLLQVSADSMMYEIGTLPLTARSDDAAALVFDLDSTDGLIPTSSLTFAWGQSVGGDIDPNNKVNILLTESAVDTWIVEVQKVVAGVGTSLYTDTIMSIGCPFSAVGIERHGGSFRAWIGSSLQSMRRLGPDFALGLLPDRVAIYQYSAGVPNPTLHLRAFRRQTNMNF